jgi:hypothetical protein
VRLKNKSKVESDDHDHFDLDYLGIKRLSSACGTHRFLLHSQHTRHHDAATMGDVEKDLTTSIVVAIWRAHNSNLVL